jgi:putative transposase
LRLVLVGWVLVEAHDEWPVADKRYLSETTLALLGVSSDSANQSVAVPAAITA